MSQTIIDLTQEPVGVWEEVVYTWLTEDGAVACAKTRMFFKYAVGPIRTVHLVVPCADQVVEDCSIPSSIDDDLLPEFDEERDSFLEEAPCAKRLCREVVPNSPIMRNVLQDDQTKQYFMRFAIFPFWLKKVPSDLVPGSTLTYRCVAMVTEAMVGVINDRTDCLEHSYWMHFLETNAKPPKNTQLKSYVLAMRLKFVRHQSSGCELPEEFLELVLAVVEAVGRIY